MSDDIKNTRINKLRLYLWNVVNNVININVDMLAEDVNNYSLDRIPRQSQVNKWVIGTTKRVDLYSFRGRLPYSQDTQNNLSNIAFFEEFEKTIAENNEKGILPEIDGIEKIECLNTGSLNNANTRTGEFDIQIQITYRSEV